MFLQEVVNLLLVGKAVTNVFNNEVSLGKEEKTVLRGITSPSNIGLLSLFEHYNSCQVTMTTFDCRLGHKKFELSSDQCASSSSVMCCSTNIVE